MVTLKFYLDARAVKAGGAAPLRLALQHGPERAFLNTSVKLTSREWDAGAQRVRRREDAAALNRRLRDFFALVEETVWDLDRQGLFAGLRASAVKNLVRDELEGRGRGRQAKARAVSRRADLLCSMVEAAVAAHTGRTRELYEATAARLREWLGARYASVRAVDVNRAWLDSFDSFLARTSPSRNARNIHLRNLRAAFNRAIDDGVTGHYPFRGYRLRPERTRKRALPAEVLRAIATVGVERWAEPYRDMFLLSFMLCGINVVDLCGLDRLHGGRVEYRRAKTGRLYSVKVEPEALALIERWRGRRHLLYMLDGHACYRTWYMQMCRGLRHVAERLRASGYEVENLTSYYARHSWATCAAALDIPKETIAAGLGHGGDTVTDIYIDFDRRKVDEANRRVIDWVFYGSE